VACVTAAFLFALSACGPSPSKQSNEAANGSGQAAPPGTSPGSSSPQASSAQPSAGPAPSDQAPASGTAGAEENSVDIGSVTIESEDGANRGQPIAVDLVFVYDASLIPQVESESAEAWFKGKAALTANAGAKLWIMSWTIAPGDEVPETAVDARSGALAAFLFAHYSGKGDHRLRIDGSGALTVTLEASDPTFEVEQ
jgi:type VI secretion system protein